MAVNIRHSKNRTVDQTRLPSPAIWGNCPWDDINDPRAGVNGITFFDDFVDYPLPGTQTTEINLGRYKVYCATAGKWITDAMPHSTTASVAGGVISALCDTDEDTAAIGTQACPFLLTTTQIGKVWFEARIAVTSILTATTSVFVGLAENQITTFAAGVPIDDDDVTSSAMAMIGFNRLNGGLGVLNTSYADHAAAWTDVGTAANSTLAANTWIKLGMKIDFQDSDRCVRFYVDNVECSSAMTRAALLALTFVDVSGLGPCLAMAAGASGTAAYTYMDWWRVAQTF